MRFDRLKLRMDDKGFDDEAKRSTAPGCGCWLLLLSPVWNMPMPKSAEPRRTLNVNQLRFGWLASPLINSKTA